MDTIEQAGATVEQGAETEQRMVSLHLCRYGRDFPGGAINPRKTDRGASAQLMATVKEDGILQPLLARVQDGLFYFSAGDRRLHAAFAAHAPHINDKGYPTPWASVEGKEIPIMIRRGGNPLEHGLQENRSRADLHPVDQMEAFAELLKGRADLDVAPMTVEEIAARFAMSPRQVRTSLRLGALVPEIRDGWRGGRLDAATAESFILCKDETQQRKILAKLEAKVGPGGRITPHHVRQALKAQPGEVRRLLTFVTRAVYEAAGHNVDQSLFSYAGIGTGEMSDPEPLVSDVAALKVMADEALANHCAVLTKLPKSEGGPWGWAKPAGEMPAGWQSWARMDLGRPLKIKDREAVGCVVSIDGEGRLHVEEAVYWQDEPAKTSGAASADGEKVAGDFGSEAGAASSASDGGNASPAADSSEDGAAGEVAPPVNEIVPVEPELKELPPRLQQQLAEQLQAGLAKALEGRNDLGLPLILAAILSGGEVVAIKSEGPNHITLWPFEEGLERYAAMDLGAQLRALAGVVSHALSLTIESGEMPPAFMPGPRMLMKVMAAKMGARKVKAHLVDAFDLDAYIKGASKGLLITAIGEACGDAQAMKLTSQGIGKVRAFAAENLRAKKWLPPELWDEDLLAPAGGDPKVRAGLKKIMTRASKKVKAAANPSARLLKRRAKKSAKRGR